MHVLPVAASGCCSAVLRHCKLTMLDFEVHIEQLMDAYMRHSELCTDRGSRVVPDP